MEKKQAHDRMEQEIASKKVALEQAEAKHREGEVSLVPSHLICTCEGDDGGVLGETEAQGNDNADLSIIRSLHDQAARLAKLDAVRNPAPVGAAGVGQQQQPGVLPQQH